MDWITTSTGIKLSYQDVGDKKSPAIILIMGLGAQMTIWPDELYFGLVEKGYRVIRFDNRDVGLSSQLNEFGNPSLIKTWVSKRLPIKHSIPYDLEDMAIDVLELMSALKIKKAHLVGASMGGMIAQIIAAKYKKRVLSLTSIMSTASYPKLSDANLKVLLKLANRPSSFNRKAAIKYNIKLMRLIGSPAYPTDENTLKQNAISNVDRAFNPAGVKRQLVAITASGDRNQLMNKIKVPTLVIHGSDDPIISIDSGKETARQIKKAKFKQVSGMGHDFPASLMPKWVKWISKLVTKAERKKLEKKLQKQAQTSEITTANS